MSSDFILDEPSYTGVEPLLNDSLFSQHAEAGRKGAPSLVKSLKPGVDVHEDAEKNLVMTFEFPGVSKDDVQFNFQNGNLTVSAETKKYEEHADNGYTLRCIKISHTIRLLQGIQDEHIKAIKENGLLTVTVTSPKSLPELAPKKITILDL